jgi:hypothetical protein
MAEHTYNCPHCNEKFTRNYKIPKGNWYKGEYKLQKNYCSKECRQGERAKEKSYKPCIQCGSPTYDVPSLPDKKFCSNQCKGKWVKENMSEERAERANYMRQFRDEDAWKKGLETRTKNGNIIDDPTWKQYWKRCDWLTSRARKKMVDDWDGYDYIDGEYIKENLNLHFSHGNYPTLDHIKPRSQCFIEGLTPREATDQLNLKWTKRSNNSAKNNKYNG